jgi:hypothetical protein
LPFGNRLALAKAAELAGGREKRPPGFFTPSRRRTSSFCGRAPPGSVPNTSERETEKETSSPPAKKFLE